MKKATLTIALAALSAAGASAQAIYGYSPALQEGTYVPLESPTVIYDGSADGATLGENFEKVFLTPSGEVTEKGAVAGFEIGFDFPFCGETMKKFVVAADGYLMVGNDTFDLDPSIKEKFLNVSGEFNAIVWLRSAAPAVWQRPKSPTRSLMRRLWCSMRTGDLCRHLVAIPACSTCRSVLRRMEISPYAIAAIPNSKGKRSLIQV